MMSTVKETPILFKPEFIRMLPWSGGDGTKGQTRRLMKPQPKACVESFKKSMCPRHHLPQLPIRWPGPHGNIIETTTNDMPVKCPYGGPGDLLYVKEGLYNDFGAVGYQHDNATLPMSNWCWEQNTLSPICMPTGAARIWLKIVSVRAERIQDISEGDAMVEGVSGHFDVVESGPHGATAVSDYRTGFKHMWTEIYGATGPESWDANPWVWAISFKEARP